MAHCKNCLRLHCPLSRSQRPKRTVLQLASPVFSGKGREAVRQGKPAVGLALPGAPTAWVPCSCLLPGTSRARQARVVACAAAAAAGSGSANNAEDLDVGRFLRVVVPTALALLLCNLDRICMSVAILPMAREYAWPASVQGLVQSAFLWGYMATQLLGGALADRLGGRLVLAGSIAWFSLASLLLPLALSAPVVAAGLALPAVLAARCLVGLGEGVALPAMNNLIAREIPPARRATALGSVYTGFHSGNLAGLVLSPLLLAAVGWRGLFLAFGVLGAPLLALWLAVVPKPTAAATQQPISRPSGGSARAAAPPAPSAGTLQLLAHPAVWAIIIVNFVNHWGYFIYLNWMPAYFYRVLGLNVAASSYLSLVPWAVMAVGSSAAGWLADGLVARGVPVTVVRKRIQTAAFLGPAAALLLLANPANSPAFAVACLAAALGITSLGQAGFVANMSDIAPRQAGRLFGLCNTFGSAAGILGTSAVGLVVEKTGSFDPVFKLTAVMYVVATVLWNLMCTGERVFD